MRKKYCQLTLAQRYEIASYLKVGKNQTEIAALIGVHRSTISREFKRNIPKRGKGAKKYVALNAQKKTENRHIEKLKHITFTDALKQQAKEWMVDKKYSPEFIAAQWVKDKVKGVSHECIYQFIWHCKHTNQKDNKAYKQLYKQLKHGKRRRKRGNYKDTRGLIPNRVSIENRPKIVEKRRRSGDIEVDLIMGKDHKSALLVTVDRATLITTIDKLESKNSTIITDKIIERMREKPPLKTMTFDNDQAFSQHEKIAAALKINTYFTRPYTSQDKGTIENRNGVIRRFFPKKTDFNIIDLKEIKRVENELNNRPVRKFGYLTPNELFLQLKVSVALIT
jgi:IS30 family transposase